VVGYLSGWISLSVGFAAPIALSAIAFAAYFPFGNLPTPLTPIVLVGMITLVHTRSLQASARFQQLSTLFKVALVLAMILAGLLLADPAGDPIVFGDNYGTELITAAFAIGLIYVSYAYSGWNAATYITEEFEQPARSIPLVLIGSTVLVTLFYTLLQFVFLRHVPMGELSGELNVGTLAATRMLGEEAGQLFGLAIALLLVSGISAMVWVGPRVTASIAREHVLWQYFRSDGQDIPVRALWLQFGISAGLLLTGTFEQIMIYCGVLLTLSTMLTVFGVFILRKQQAQATFRSPLFPLFQVLYLLLSVWMIAFAFIHNTTETLLGMSNLVLGLITYLWSKQKEKA
jgi:APA family basic amino acid/polyamine antiporter